VGNRRRVGNLHHLGKLEPPRDLVAGQLGDGVECTVAGAIGKRGDDDASGIERGGIAVPRERCHEREDGDHYHGPDRERDGTTRTASCRHLVNHRSCDGWHRTLDLDIGRRGRILRLEWSARGSRRRGLARPHFRDERSGLGGRLDLVLFG
jgi:hypothetical protein